MPPGSVQKAPQQRFFGAPEQGHVDAGLGAAQGREQRDHDDLVQLVALGVAGPRVLKLGKTGPKPLHAVPLCNQDGKIRSIFLHKKNSTNFLCDSPATGVTGASQWPGRAVELA